MRVKNDDKRIYLWAVPLVQDVSADSNTFLFCCLSCFWKVRMTLPCKVTEGRTFFAISWTWLWCQTWPWLLSLEKWFTTLFQIIWISFWMSRQFRWFSDPVQRVMIFKDVRDKWNILGQRNLQKLLTRENLKNFFNVLLELRLLGVERR